MVLLVPCDSLSQKDHILVLRLPPSFLILISPPVAGLAFTFSPS